MHQVLIILEDDAQGAAIRAVLGQLQANGVVLDRPILDAPLSADVVLVQDRYRSGVSALAALDALRRRCQRITPAVVWVTGHLAEHERGQLRDLGAAAFVSSTENAKHVALLLKKVAMTPSPSAPPRPKQRYADGFTVVITEKGGKPKSEVFQQSEITIGRVQGNDIVLPKGNISKRHSRIVLRDGNLIIVDLKSSNGTYVNGKRINSPQVLKESDKIYVGDFTLMIEPLVIEPSSTAAVTPPVGYPPPPPPVAPPPAPTTRAPDHRAPVDTLVELLASVQELHISLGRVTAKRSGGDVTMNVADDVACAFVKELTGIALGDVAVVDADSVSPRGWRVSAHAFPNERPKVMVRQESASAPTSIDDDAVVLPTGGLAKNVSFGGKRKS